MPKSGRAAAGLPLPFTDHHSKRYIALTGPKFWQTLGDQADQRGARASVQRDGQRRAKPDGDRADLERAEWRRADRQRERAHRSTTQLVGRSTKDDGALQRRERRLAQAAEPQQSEGQDEVTGQ